MNLFDVLVILVNGQDKHSPLSSKIIEDREKLSYINQNIIESTGIYTMDKHTEDIMKLYEE